LEADKLYDQHLSVLREAKYLESITEDLIYETYREAIVCDHTRTFTEFNQDHRDAYLRLKMRGIRPASFISPVSFPQNLGITIEEERKSSESIVIELLSLSSLDSMISRMDQKLIISST
jgi:hypothetical protein